MRSVVHTFFCKENDFCGMKRNCPCSCESTRHGLYREVVSTFGRVSIYIYFPHLFIARNFALDLTDCHFPPSPCLSVSRVWVPMIVLYVLLSQPTWFHFSIFNPCWGKGRNLQYTCTTSSWGCIYLFMYFINHIQQRTNCHLQNS